jgi:hypothetical protein
MGKRNANNGVSAPAKARKKMGDSEKYKNKNKGPRQRADNSRALDGNDRGNLVNTLTLLFVFGTILIIFYLMLDRMAKRPIDSDQ